MKVMSYNTLLGEFDGTDDRRFLAQKAAIAAVNPNVLFLALSNLLPLSAPISVPSVPMYAWQKQRI